MRDERNWEHKPWFQLASMAQTRAGAKALRNRMAWVAVLAGYAPTPYEEMEQTPTESHQTHQDSILGGETQKGRGRGRPAKNPPKIENTDKLSKETLAMAYTMMGSEAEAVEFILNQSTFQSEKTGELIKAKSLDHLAKSQKWLQSTYGRVREEYEAWQKTQNPPQESEEEYLQNQ